MESTYRIKSYVKREGKLTKGQAKAFKEFYPLYGITLNAKDTIDLNQIYGNSLPTVLEIGFGNGDALIHSALTNPKANYLGIEVYRPGIGALLIKLQQQNIKNIRVHHGDAVNFLENHVENNSVKEIRIYFPDPWHKKRHHKRRLIQSDFVELLCKKLHPNGLIHLATDWEPYAEQMMAVLEKNKQLKNTVSPHQYAPRPDSRPITKFEKRGNLLGHGVWDLLFVKDQL